MAETTQTNGKHKQKSSRDVLTTSLGHRATGQSQKLKKNKSPIKVLYQTYFLSIQKTHC